MKWLQLLLVISKVKWGLFDGWGVKWKTSLCWHPCEASWLVLMFVNVS